MKTLILGGLAKAASIFSLEQLWRAPKISDVIVGPVDFQLCDNSMAEMFVLNPNSTSGPNPLIKGVNMTVNLLGTLGQNTTVEMSKILLDVSNQGVSIDQRDLWDKQMIKNGSLNTTFNWLVPSLATSGNYTMNMTGIDSKGNSVYCVLGTFPIDNQ